jgi:hypothetical protein
MRNDVLSGCPITLPIDDGSIGVESECGSVGAHYYSPRIVFSEKHERLRSRPLERRMRCCLMATVLRFGAQSEPQEQARQAEHIEGKACLHLERQHVLFRRLAGLQCSDSSIARALVR